MDTAFQHTDCDGDRVTVKMHDDGSELVVSVFDSEGGVCSAYIPRAALLEWLNDGKPEAQAAQAAFIVTDEMIAKGCEARSEEDDSDNWNNNTYNNMRRILTAALSAANVSVWEPCEREDIRKGDRWRAEWDDHATEGLSQDDWESSIDNAIRYFRIPAPVETAEWPQGEPGDLYRIDYTDSDGKKRDGAVAYLNANKDGLYPVDPSFPFLFRSSLGDPQRKDVLHKVTRLKVVEA